jgi:hypothetical protein
MCEVHAQVPGLTRALGRPGARTANAPDSVKYAALGVEGWRARARCVQAVELRRASARRAQAGGVHHRAGTQAAAPCRRPFATSSIAARRPICDGHELRRMPELQRQHGRRACSADRPASASIRPWLSMMPVDRRQQGGFTRQGQVPVPSAASPDQPLSNARSATPFASAALRQLEPVRAGSPAPHSWPPPACRTVGGTTPWRSAE